jgi:uncharacterized membrane protein (UPF0127 family)
MMKTILAALALLVFAAGPALAQDQAPSVKPDNSDLTIETAAGKRFHFTVELALTPPDQERGLMFRKTMAPDAGMLFVFDVVEPQAFWMKNTLIPLDMIFIRTDGTIANIVENAPPQTLDARTSDGPAKAVLELNGGITRFLSIRPGDRVIHPLIATTAPAQ